MPDSWVPGLVLETGPDDRAGPHGRKKRPTLNAAGSPGPGGVRRLRDSARRRPRLVPSGPGREEAGGSLLDARAGAASGGRRLVLESATGAMRAMVGGWDFRRSRFNRATQALRQVGSSFKPFVFGAALENGFTPADTLFDAPALVSRRRRPADLQPAQLLPALLRDADPAPRTRAFRQRDFRQAHGPRRRAETVDFARRCGITSALPPYPSLALGSADLMPLEVAAAYAAFANQGRLVKPYFVERVLSGGGRTLEQHEAEAPKAPSRRRLRPDLHARGGDRPRHRRPSSPTCRSPSPARPARPTTTPTPGSSATHRGTPFWSGSATTRSAPSARR